MTELTLPAALVLENFRQSILFALDQACERQFRGLRLPDQPGATDADLPELFAAIDAHTRRLAERYGVTLTEEVV